MVRWNIFTTRFTWRCANTRGARPAVQQQQSSTLKAPNLRQKKGIAIHPESIQDRDGAAQVLTKQVRRRFPFIEVIFADAGCQGPSVRNIVSKSGTWKIEIIKRPDYQKGFAVIAKRWIVERTLAWISCNRRLARDFENLTRTATLVVDCRQFIL